jgi:hypothetical protein
MRMATLAETRVEMRMETQAEMRMGTQVGAPGGDVVAR